MKSHVMRLQAHIRKKPQTSSIYLSMGKMDGKTRIRERLEQATIRVDFGLFFNPILPTEFNSIYKKRQFFRNREPI